MPKRPEDLNTLLKKSTAGIDALVADPAGKDAEAFARQLRVARADLFRPLGDPRVAEEASRLLAAAMLSTIKEIPRIVEAMMNAIDRRTTEPAVRCALIGALAYLVKPRDLLPDGLPGGFGFVDDTMILRAALTEFVKHLPPGFTTAERERRLLEMLAVCVPPPQLSEFQNEVEGIWLAFHILLWKTEDENESIACRLEADPLGTPLPDADRESIPLPPGPRLSMAPGSEILEFQEGALVVRFKNGGLVRIDERGGIVALT